MSAARLQVGGITPFTATDFPGRLALAVFIQGCPWRCGYCHNPHLQPRGPGAHRWEDVIALLERRRGLLDGVVFSGGEPTIDPALAGAMAEVRAMGLQVGLHTACIYPRRLAEVLPLLDWIGFDIKAPYAEYERITGVAGSGEPARECAAMIVASGVPHECRTTLHPALLSAGVVEQLADDLAQLGVRHYALQMFRAQGCGNKTLADSAASGYLDAATLARIGARFDSFTLRLPD
ncbi:MAG: anaerobic ribonucleoside-triphosphate reductase activating protein [Massilia sp.]